MGNHISGGTVDPTRNTFALLDTIITALGSTKTTFFPFLESVGGSVVQQGIRSYKENQHDLISRDEAAVRTLEAEFSPYMHVGGVHSYNFDSAGSKFLLGTDDGNLGFPTNADFSVGAFVYPRDDTTVTIMGKYDVNDAREWRLGLNGSKKLELEVLDETEASNGTRIGAGDTDVAIDQWNFVCATTNNNDADASMSFYLDGVADGTGNTETGTYNDSPDTAGLFAIGVTLNTQPAVTNIFSGRIALPFVCGKVLTQANVTTIYNTGRTLLGLA